MEYIVAFFHILMWLFVAGMVLMSGWCAWVYITDLPSYTEMTEEEEKRMLAEMPKRGLRASEIGGDHD